MKTITVVLPLPPQILRPNARAHYMAKARATSETRYDATLAATHARDLLHVGKDFQISRPVVSVRWFFKDADTRTRDEDNLLAWLKAYFDGIVDSGIVGDDGGFTHNPPTLIRDKDQRVEITFKERE